MLFFGFVEMITLCASNSSNRFNARKNIFKKSDSDTAAGWGEGGAGCDGAWLSCRTGASY